MRTQRGGLQKELGAGIEREGTHHSVKAKSKEHQEEDDGPERREGQPG